MFINWVILIEKIYLFKALSPEKLPFHMLLPGLKCKVTITKVIFLKQKIPFQ